MGLPPPDETNPLGGFTIPRFVRSRRREVGARQLAAFSIEGEHALMLIPETAELLVGAEIVSRLAAKTDTPWAVGTDDAGRLYEWISVAGLAVPDFKATGAVREARAYKAIGGMTECSGVYATFTDFGWGKRARALVLDPTAFSDRPIVEILGAPVTGEDVSRRLMRIAIWAADVIDWCRSAGVNVRPGRGGIASQFLTDSRWWPERRRKAPRRLNAEAREELPGNYYRLFSGDRYAHALELDQKSSHHNVAARVEFTDADTLHGYGATGERATLEARLLCRPGDARWSELRAMRGLFYVRVIVGLPAVTRTVPLPQIAAEGEHVIPVWSTELDDIEAEPYVTIVGIVGAIASRTSCTALNGYARWALDQLAEHADNARRMLWLKPLLLAVYGTMAQSPKPHVSFSTEPTARSNPEMVVLGNQLTEVHVARSVRAQEPRYVNVADRGIIEAETRAETVRVARAIEQLHDDERSAELVALYADSVLVAPGARLGSRAGDGDEHGSWVREIENKARSAGRGVWRSSELTQLQMLAVNAYQSTEVTKRPGVSRASREAV